MWRISAHVEVKKSKTIKNSCIYACSIYVWYMYVVYAHIMYVGMHTCACTTEAQESIRCPALSLLTLLRQGLSLDLQLGWQPTSPSDPSFYPSPVVGIWTQVFILAQQVLLPTMPSPQTKHSVHFNQRHHTCYLKKQTETSIGSYFNSVQKK